MRELLERWAKLEPDRCEKSNNPRLSNIFTVQAGEDAKNIYDPDHLSGLELACIQWAVQAAIVSRGWVFSLEWDGEWEALVNQLAHYNLNSPVVALLGAYLEALEER